MFKNVTTLSQQRLTGTPHPLKDVSTPLPTTVRSALPSSSVSLSTLRTLEEEFQRRGITTRTICYPLWFHAEGEKNELLVNSHGDLSGSPTEFWVDIPEMVASRRKALGEMSDSAVAIDEEGYLNQLFEQLLLLGPHTHAMSMVTALLEDELQEVHQEPQVCLLPTHRG